MARKDKTANRYYKDLVEAIQSTRRKCLVSGFEKYECDPSGKRLVRICERCHEIDEAEEVQRVFDAAMALHKSRDGGAFGIAELEALWVECEKAEEVERG